MCGFRDIQKIRQWVAAGPGADQGGTAVYIWWGAQSNSYIRRWDHSHHAVWQRTTRWALYGPCSSISCCCCCWLLIFLLAFFLLLLLVHIRVLLQLLLICFHFSFFFYFSFLCIYRSCCNCCWRLWAVQTSRIAQQKCSQTATGVPKSPESLHTKMSHWLAIDPLPFRLPIGAWN